MTRRAPAPPPLLPLHRADAVTRIRKSAFDDSSRWQKPGIAPTPLLEEGLLQTPRFVPDPPWLSASVVGLFGHTGRLPSGVGYAHRIGWSERDGEPIWGDFPCLPGWAENDLARRAPDIALMQRAEPILKQMLAERLGGSTWADPANIVLVAGLHLVFAAAPFEAAETMLDHALASTEAARVVMVKSASLMPLEPEEFTKLAEKLRRRGGQVVQAPCDPWPLLEHAEALHCGGDDPAALLGLLVKIKVYCHTPGLAAGWGATVDSPLIRKQAAARTTMEILASALLTGSRYASPFDGKQISIETALEIASDWRRLGAVNRRIGGLVGFPRQDRVHLEKFFHTGQSVPVHGSASADAKAGQYVAVWTGPMPDGLAGSLHANGLGMLWTAPGLIERPGEKQLSIVLDDEGDYHDQACPNGLEKLLNRAVFDQTILSRARAVMARIKNEKLSLRGFPIGEPIALDAPRSKRRILLLDDAVPKGKPLKLLAALRETYADAYIIYCADQARPAETKLADRSVSPAEALSLLERVDDIHTGATSLGFEAILHGYRPVCELASFYSGWGLTNDRFPSVRRERSLTLEEIVASVLLLYHRYLDPQTGFPCPLDLVLDCLREPLAPVGNGKSWFKRLFGGAA